VAVPELFCARRQESGHVARGGPGAAVGPGGGSWSYEACGGPGVVMCQETGAGAMGHVAVPELSRALVAGAGATRHVAALELPCARRWETRACAPILSFVLTWSLCMEVSGLQGTDTVVDCQGAADLTASKLKKLSL
jgi:hypothetical protein